jgi:hypothetical protein
MSWHSNLPHNTTEAHIDRLTDEHRRFREATLYIQVVEARRRYQAWVDGHEDKYATVYGRSREEVVGLMVERVEEVDGGELHDGEWVVEGDD